MTLPKDIDFMLWWSSLVVDFPMDNIPFLPDESQWKEYGNYLVRENSFSDAGAPGTQTFSDKFEWAQAVFKCMAHT